MKLDHIAIDTRRFMQTDAYTTLMSWILKRQKDSESYLCEQSPTCVEPARITMERQRIDDMKTIRRWFNQLAEEMETETVDE